MTAIDFNKWDFRLLEVSSELFALEDLLQLIENQMKNLQKSERIRVDEYIRNAGLSIDESEMQEAMNEYYYRIDFLLPRFFRSSFLISLYGVYESSVTEISHLIKKKQSQDISIDDLRGGFLERANKYYKHILKFKLYVEKEEWDSVNMLSDLRNAFAHENGRMEMLKENKRDVFKDLIKKDLGISTYQGYIICDDQIVAKIFNVVRKSLEDIVKRYKLWDDQQ